MKCWKLSKGQFLIEGEPVPFPTNYITAVHLPGGDTIYRATPYYVVTSGGQVITTYSTPEAYSLEDVLYLYNLYAVTGGRLCRFLWQEQWGYEARVSVEEVLMNGLTECPISDLPFDPATFDPENRV